MSTETNVASGATDVALGLPLFPSLVHPLVIPLSALFWTTCSLTIYNALSFEFQIANGAHLGSGKAQIFLAIALTSWEGQQAILQWRLFCLWALRRTPHLPWLNWVWNDRISTRQRNGGAYLNRHWLRNVAPISLVSQRDLPTVRRCSGTGRVTAKS